MRSTDESGARGGRNFVPAATRQLHHFYLRDHELQFIALTEAISPPEGVVSSNGEYFGFVAGGDDITAEDNGGLKQAYIYDVGAGEVSCASCVGGGEANTTAASFDRPREDGPTLAWFTFTNEPIRNVSDDGHIFFVTGESLKAADTNGKRDVYVWQDDELDLLSTGRSTDHSYLMDASVDGSTVFIKTRSQLVEWDIDTNMDAYAVRVGGGLPAPPAAPASCSGDGCQGSPSGAPEIKEPGSANLMGSGNPSTDPDCSSSRRDMAKAKRKARQQKQKAKSLKRKARKASGDRAKRLEGKARKAGKRGRKAGKQRRKAQKQLRNCRSGR